MTGLAQRLPLKFSGHYSLSTPRLRGGSSSTAFFKMLA